jgi:hypothetical protein
VGKEGNGGFGCAAHVEGQGLGGVCVGDAGELTGIPTRVRGGVGMIVIFWLG